MLEPQSVRKFLDYIEAKAGQRGGRHKYRFVVLPMLEELFRLAIEEGIFEKKEEDSQYLSGWEQKKKN